MFMDQMTQVGLMKGTKEPGKKFDLCSKSWNSMEKTWCGLDQNMLKTILISHVLQGES